MFGDVELEERERERESGSEDELGLELVRLREAALRREERRREREEEREGKRRRGFVYCDEEEEVLTVQRNSVRFVNLFLQKLLASEIRTKSSLSRSFLTITTLAQTKNISYLINFYFMLILCIVYNIMKTVLFKNA